MCLAESFGITKNVILNTIYLISIQIKFLNYIDILFSFYFFFKTIFNIQNFDIENDVENDLSFDFKSDIKNDIIF